MPRPPGEGGRGRGVGFFRSHTLTEEFPKNFAAYSTGVIHRSGEHFAYAGPEAVAAIEAAWDEIEQQAAILAARGIRVTIAYDHDAGRFVMRSASHIEH